MYPAIDAASENALVGGCAFVAVLPADSEAAYPVGVVYTGAEATVLFDSRSENVEVGLAIHKRDGDGHPIEYLMFLRGEILRLDKEGKIIKSKKISLNEVLMVEWVHGRDIASKPYGRSIFTKGAISALDSGQRTKKLAEIAEDLRIGGGVFVIAAGRPEDNSMRTTTGKAGRITTAFADDGANSVRIETLNLPSAEKLQEQMNGHANDYSAATFISSTSLGYQPTNGSFSAESLIEQNKPYAYVREAMRSDFAKSIRKLAVLLMGLATGKIEDEWRSIEPVFCNVKSSGATGIGDELLKLKEFGFDLPLEDYVREELGIQLKPKMLQVPMPNFNAARELQELSKELDDGLIDADGKVNSQYKSPDVL
jgi:hypothetical protein